jgi:hypothetical protein
MSRRGRNAAAIAGLVVTIIFAAGLLVVVVNRNSPSASSSLPADPGGATAYSQVQWHATKIPATSSLSPFLAVSAGRLYMVTDVGQGSPHGPGLWSSADAVQWQQAPNPGMEPDFVARAAMTDGNGGLVVVGELTPTDTNVVPQIWHSTDGKTFAKAQVELPGVGSASTGRSGEIVSVAIAAGQMVAFGDHDVVDATMNTASKGSEVRGLDAWHSTDGSTWAHSELGGSDGYQAISMTAWSGGFAALATESGKGSGYGVWLSTDGIAWHKAASVPAITAVSIIALPRGLVVVGGKQDAVRGMAPASWSSSDGETWSEAIASATGPAVGFDGAIVVGHSVVAIALSHMGVGTGTGGGPSQSPGLPVSVPPSTWILNDGSTWQSVGAAPAFWPYMASMTIFDGRVVVATVSGVAEVTVSVGDLS